MESKIARRRPFLKTLLHTQPSLRSWARQNVMLGSNAPCSVKSLTHRASSRLFKNRSWSVPPLVILRERLPLVILRERLPFSLDPVGLAQREWRRVYPP